MTDMKMTLPTGYRFLVPAAVLMLILIITLVLILRAGNGAVRIYAASQDFGEYLSNAANEAIITTDNPDEKRTSVTVVEEKTAGRADIAIEQYPAGKTIPYDKNSGIIAVDPMVWIVDRELLPIGSNEYSLQNFGPEMFSLWNRPGYPITIPGDEPELFLPVLVKLETDISGGISAEVLTNWQELLKTPREWRRTGYFDRAYELLDNWAAEGIITPEWSDIDGVAYFNAISGKSAGAFLETLSWKRKQKRELSFHWTVIQSMPGRTRRNISIVGRAVSLTVNPPGFFRRDLSNELEAVVSYIASTTGAEELINNSGYTPVVSSPPFVNKEDRDSRAALQAAIGWIIYP